MHPLIISTNARLANHPTKSPIDHYKSTNSVAESYVVINLAKLSNNINCNQYAYERIGYNKTSRMGMMRHVVAVVRPLL